MKTKNSEITVKHILRKIRLYENGAAVDSMENLGLKYIKNYGVSIRDLKVIANEFMPNHKLACELRSTNIRETRILADMIDDIKVLSELQIDETVSSIDTHELAEQICINLLEKTDRSRKNIFNWIKSDKEFVLTIGFILYSRYALIDKKSEDIFFENFLPYAVINSKHKSIHVRKAIGRALRQTALRNDDLHSNVIKTINEIRNNKSTLSELIIEEVVPLINF